ncbi:hypothetical protein OEA41_007500 [Lepraria neglecta]|uniref:Uncharacterized protein n=1 Tax=Lepraria neglecta TaxID=209136 RepID=A0AAD9ZD82_9LECA|nr:hypothetical protein OEA41_007500 [Lepraria neglecta]
MAYLLAGGPEPVVKLEDGTLVCLKVPPHAHSRPERQNVDPIKVSHKKGGTLNLSDFRKMSDKARAFGFVHQSQVSPAAYGSYYVLWGTPGDHNPVFEHRCSMGIIGEVIILKDVDLDARQMEFLDMPEEFEEPVVYKELFAIIKQY